MAGFLPSADLRHRKLTPGSSHLVLAGFLIEGRGFSPSFFVSYFIFYHSPDLAQSNVFFHVFFVGGMC